MTENVTPKSAPRLIRRREVLAFIALTDAPMPLSVDFEWGTNPAVFLEFDDLAEAEPWFDVFGVAEHLRRPADYPAYICDEWRDWPLWISIKSSASGDRLDDATRTRLTALTTEAVSG